ncbi:MAG: hypothetical protein ACPG8V_03455 [Alphaproteobacteria bacterium]
MNIFFLDTNIKKSIKAHCDKHVVKMILEYAQILSTSHIIVDGDNCLIRDNIYKPTHKNHPCVVWTTSHISHYNIVYNMLIESISEYTYRYKKQHKTSRLLEYLKNPPANINRARTTYKVATTKFHSLPEQCMPEQYHIKPKSDDDLASVINAYRNYYICEKSDILRYTKRNKPSWITF